MKTKKYALIRSAHVGEIVMPNVTLGALKPNFFELEKNKEYIGLQLIQIDKDNRVTKNYGIIEKI
jgi:hypothetical protein